jgi:hypothetical protein
MAGHVTEREILSLMKATFKRAAEHCDKLAVLPARGPTYRRLREDLQICENCCRQVAWYREDARWLRIGLMMEEAHKRAGGWLRDRTMPRTENSNLAHPLFVRLAENLRFGAARAEQMENAATGRVGMILPKPLRGAARTQGRMVQVPSGLIVPREYAA